jgi:hypothetical protein
MISFVDLLIRARCQELNYVCCVPREKLYELRDLLDGMTDSDLETFYDTICMCAVDGGQPSPGQPTTPGVDPLDCSKRFTDTLCTNETLLAAVIAAQEAVDWVLFGTMATPIPAQVKAALFIVGNALEAWVDACAVEGITNSVLHGMCSAADTIRETYDLLGPLALPLKPVEWLFESSGFADYVRECCNDQAVQDAPLPEWTKENDAQAMYETKRGRSAA